MLAGIQAGGTRFLVGVGTGPDDLRVREIPTRAPDPTVRALLDWLAPFAPEISALGVASFGPLELDRSSPDWGRIGPAPKIEWRGFRWGSLAERLGVPTALDTDANGAALGELRWGNGRGANDLLYGTVGTGIGGGAIANGRLLRGRIHPEMGHVLVPREPSDPYPGCCPSHGDCLEGLASGPALAGRWGRPAEELPPEHPAWRLEAWYLARGLANWVLTLAPERVVLGGGVLRQPGLLTALDAELRAVLAGYVELPSDLIRPSALGDRAGLLGALGLAEELLAARDPPSERGP